MTKLKNVLHWNIDIQKIELFFSVKHLRCRQFFIFFKECSFNSHMRRQTSQTILTFLSSFQICFGSLGSCPVVEKYISLLISNFEFFCHDLYVIFFFYYTTLYINFPNYFLHTLVDKNNAISLTYVLMVTPFGNERQKANKPPKLSYITSLQMIIKYGVKMHYSMTLFPFGFNQIILCLLTQGRINYWNQGQSSGLPSKPRSLS